MRLNETVFARRRSSLARTARRPLGVAVAAALLFGGLHATAASAAEWTGGTSTDWFDAGNWSAPPSGARVFINTQAPNRSVLAGQHDDVSLLVVGHTRSAALDILDGGSLRVSGDGSGSYGFGALLGWYYASEGNAGTVTVSGEGSTLTVDAGTSLGFDGTGVLSVRDGGTANLGLGQAFAETYLGLGVSGWYVQTNQGNGRIEIEGNGSVVNYAGGLNVFSGAVDIHDGGRLVSHVREADGNVTWLDVIGFDVPSEPTAADGWLGGTGRVDISGADSAWISGNSLTVGYGGAGTLSIRDGGTGDFTGSVRLGTLSYAFDAPDGGPYPDWAGLGGSGQVLVSGAGSMLRVRAKEGMGSGYIAVGYFGGAGALSVSDHGVVNADGDIVVGAQGLLAIGGLNADGRAKAPGTIEAANIVLDDPMAGLQLHHDADDYTLAPSISGNGHIAAEAGFTRLSGDSSGFEGAVDIDRGATLEVTGKLSGHFTIGDTGTGDARGVLRVVDGGDVRGLSAVLGETVDGQGDVLVSGAGSRFSVDGELLVGRVGRGSLTVTDGGTVRAVLDAPGIGIDVGSTYPFEVRSDDPADAHEPWSGVGTVRVDGAGSSLSYGSGFYVHNGSVEVTDGARLIHQLRDSDAAYGWLWTETIGSGMEGHPDAEGVRGTGSVTVSGTGSAWHSLNFLQVGNGGDGVLSILDGGEARFAQSAELGMAPLVFNPATFIQVDGRAGSAAVQVSGIGSTLSIGGGTSIGVSGNASLLVSDGGTANLGLDQMYAETQLGFGGYGMEPMAEQGYGSLKVEGAGSVVNYAGGINVLNGEVEVEAGGQLVSHLREVDGDTTWVDVVGYGVPADPDGSDEGLHGFGEVTVHGAGSAWNSSNGLQVGLGGAGRLSVLDGGKAGFAGHVTVGATRNLYAPYVPGEPLAVLAEQGGDGRVLVSGEGSTLSVAPQAEGLAGVIFLGTNEGSTGSLTVNDGGMVTAPGGITLGAGGRLVIGQTEGEGAARAAGRLEVSGIALAAPEASLTFRHTDTLYLFDTAMSGNGRIDVSGGFTRLTGDSHGFTGNTTVGGGATLSVNGKLGGDILVDADGTLEGLGTVGNVTVDGTLSPGNSPGTLHVDGDLVMREGSIYAAEINPATGASDSVEVAGNVTIEPGTTLSVESLGDEPLRPGMNLDLIHTTGDDSTVSGQFDNTTGAIGAFMGYGVTYEDGLIKVGVTRSEAGFASVGGATSGLPGAALDSLADDNPLAVLMFSEVTTPEQAKTTLAAMAGSMNADMHRVLLDDSRSVRDAISSQLQQAADMGGQGTRWWTQAMGHWGSQDGRAGLDRARANGSGLLMGVDTGVGTSTRLGVTAGAGQGSYDTTGQDAHLKNRHLAVYGRSGFGGFGLSYGAGSSWHEIHARRHFAIGSSLQSTDSHHDARTDQAFIDAGYRFVGDKGYIEPFVAVAHVRLHDDAATEKGSVAALVTPGSSDNATFGTLGMRWAARGENAQWYGSLGWRHAFGAGQTRVTQSFAAGGVAFETYGLPLARNAAAVELGARFDLSGRVHVSAGYAGLWGGSGNDQGAQMRLTVDL